MERCNCGGTLRPATVAVQRRVAKSMYVTFTEGLRCDRCGDEVVSRDIAVQMRKPVSTWLVPSGLPAEYGDAKQVVGGTPLVISEGDTASTDDSPYIGKTLDTADVV